MLDEPAVARALCGCPIPVVVGAGHRIDRTLADQVAWASVDTPSKALALAAGVVATAARTARTDWAAITEGAALRLTTHAHQLEGARREAFLAVTQASTTAIAEVRAAWSAVQLAAASAGERNRGRQADADALLVAVMAAARQGLEREDRQLQQRLRASLDRVTTLVARLDAGAALAAEIEARASALLQRQSDALLRLHEEALRAASLHLTEAMAAIERLAVEVEGSDLATLLQRGLAVVTDTAGQVLPTRAAAQTHGVLTLHFADGRLAVMPVNSRVAQDADERSRTGSPGGRVTSAS